MKQETGKKWKNEKKLKKRGREFLFHNFNMGKSNLVFHTVSDNSWILHFLVLGNSSFWLQAVNIVKI